MTRSTIVDQLITDLETKLNSNEGYKCDLTKVYRGYFQWDDIKQTPALAITVIGDDPYQDEFGSNVQSFRKLKLMTYGYSKSNGTPQPIHDLLEDFESFLYSDDFTYRDYLVEQLGTVEVYEGGNNDPALIFQIEWNLIYHKE